jgi:hypothetical protein
LWCAKCQYATAILSELERFFVTEVSLSRQTTLVPHDLIAERPVVMREELVAIPHKPLMLQHEQQLHAIGAAKYAARSLDHAKQNHASLVHDNIVTRVSRD